MKYLKYGFFILLLILISCGNNKKAFERHNKLAHVYAASDSLELAIKEWRLALKADPENELAPQVRDNILKAKMNLKLDTKFTRLARSADAAACKQNMASIESAANFGFSKNVLVGNNSYPSSIREMVNRGFLDYEPGCPSGGVYLYDSKTGKVECTVHGKL